ncbi:MAG: tRNA pseudouridine(38-40) synthase TruA [Streptococcaceae bacterium]|jgi:tRNA pseudouridine38-40 synthase|nr:tRNA pseudouridine(38-40) synthase TruA [Streptococcaceae bacterium]
MPRYKATIAYDGTDFAGFQRQENAPRTVQGVLEDVLYRLNSNMPVSVQGAGRTDAGVHALEQVVHFDMLEAREPEKLRFALDTQSPDDLAILAVEPVTDDWHARYNKHTKTYEYRLNNSPIRSPFTVHTEAWFRYPLDLQLLTSACELLVGKHDFAGFMASGSQVENTIRTLSEARVHTENETFIFTFTGNGFLYKQVRNMVGTLIKIGNGKWPVTRISEILETKNRTLAGPTAAPEGLYLKAIHYEEGKFTPDDYA